MPKFTIRYDRTERVVEEIEVEAKTLEEAIELVEHYEFDTSDAYEVESLEWSIDNVQPD